MSLSRRFLCRFPFHNGSEFELVVVCASPPAKMSAGAPAAAQPPSGKAIFALPVPTRSSAWNETTRIEDEAIRAEC
jgi:hypothetical protein